MSKTPVLMSLFFFIFFNSSAIKVSSPAPTSRIELNLIFFVRFNRKSE